MALQGKWPAVIKKTSRQPRCRVDRKDKRAARPFILTVGNVGFLLLLVYVAFAHDPAAVAPIAVRAEDVPPVLCPPDALQLLRALRVDDVNTQL